MVAVSFKKIYVIGQVNQPGEFIMNPRVDVMQALSLAGGTTAFASPNSIFVLRRDNGEQQRLPFNFDAVALAPGGEATPALTAAGLLSREFLGWEKDQPELIAGSRYLLENLPSAGSGRGSMRGAFTRPVSSRLLR